MGSSVGGVAGVTQTGTQTTTTTTSAEACRAAGKYWYQDACHDQKGAASNYKTADDCWAVGYWWRESSNVVQCRDNKGSADDYLNQADCQRPTVGFHWYNGDCHDNSPDAWDINNSGDCAAYSFSWWTLGKSAPPNDGCHPTSQLAYSSTMNRTTCEANDWWWHDVSWPSSDHCDSSHP